MIGNIISNIVRPIIINASNPDIKNQATNPSQMYQQTLNIIVSVVCNSGETKSMAINGFVLIAGMLALFFASNFILTISP